MKIGLLTFHSAVNYGGVLQAVALSRFLTSIGIQNEIIDYQNELFAKQYNPIQKGKNPIKNLVRVILVTPKQKKKNEAFRDFIINNANVSSTVSKKELPFIQQNYDLISTGSDQVFCPGLTGGDMSYFLDFVVYDNKKISYAASFGGTGLDVRKYPEALEYLKKFYKLSIRESAGVEFLKKYCICSEKHCDPTLLLNQSEWEKLAEKPQMDGYILLYTLGRGEYVEETVQQAKILAHRCNKKILYICDSFSNDKSIQYVRYSSPEKFIGLFANADIVVTNSFHGTVFSIIFHKEFYSNYNLPNNKGERMQSLLTMTGIKQGDFFDSIQKQTNSNISWNEVEDKLNYEREKSEAYFMSLIT